MIQVFNDICRALGVTPLTELEGNTVLLTAAGKTAVSRIDIGLRIEEGLKIVRLNGLVISDKEKGAAEIVARHFRDLSS